MGIKEKFLTAWSTYFPGADLPFTLYYTDRPQGVETVKPPSERRCFISDLAKVRNGRALCFGVESIGCFGGKRYTGFQTALMPNFEYFLSSGIPGRLEGERYKKTPELVKQLVEQSPAFIAPAKYLVAKRWDTLEAGDEPVVVVFFAPPDVLAGLFTLASFDEADLHGVITPFAAGCGTIIQYPYLENAKEHPRCVIGMFDVSARPCVPAGTLSFAAPMRRFVRMVENMAESFLITHSWEMVKKRIEQARGSEG